MYSVGLVGAGNMGRAMVAAWIDSGVLESNDVGVVDKDLGRARLLEREKGVTVVESIAELASEASTVVLAVKPQDSAGVLAEMKGRIGPAQVLMSIAAGLTVDNIRRAVGPEPCIVRVMPNMGAMVRAAASGFTVSSGTGECDTGTAREMLSAIGEAVEVEESLMDLVTAVSGSGPAYFFYLTEALEKAAVELGMPAETAGLLARETLWGAAKTVKETGSDPGALRRAVSSPGGTTLAALERMDSGGFSEMIAGAVDAARRRAAELAD